MLKPPDLLVSWDGALLGQTDREGESMAMGEEREERRKRIGGIE